MRREGLGITHHFSKGKESINTDTPFRCTGMITEVGTHNKRGLQAAPYRSFVLSAPIRIRGRDFTVGCELADIDANGGTGSSSCRKILSVTGVK